MRNKDNSDQVRTDDAKEEDYWGRESSLVGVEYYLPF